MTEIQCSNSLILETDSAYGKNMREKKLIILWIQGSYLLCLRDVYRELGFKTVLSGSKSFAFSFMSSALWCASVHFVQLFKDV